MQSIYFIQSIMFDFELLIKIRWFISRDSAEILISIQHFAFFSGERT